MKVVDNENHRKIIQQFKKTMCGTCGKHNPDLKGKKVVEVKNTKTGVTMVAEVKPNGQYKFLRKTSLRGTTGK